MTEPAELLSTSHEEELIKRDFARRPESFEEEIRVLKQKIIALEDDLKNATNGSKVDRQSRRAALNLMEDAVHARRAGQMENAERRKVEEKLIEADRRKDEFLATLAHELRNPLAPIRNSLQLLRIGKGDCPTSKRLCDMLDRQVNHMVRLVDDLMEVSRITRGTIGLQKKRVDLENIIQSSVEASTPIIHKSGHRLSVDVPSEPVQFEADPVRLVQIITNLLNNAAKYTEPGGSIDLTAAFDGEKISVSVRDTGVGVTAEMLPKIFDLFTQVDRSLNRSQGGLGIGLTLARTLAEAHGGTIEGRSDGIGHGSEFKVSIPLTEDSPVFADEQRDRAPSEALPLHRILIVDDNQDAASTLGGLLELLGATVLVSNDGRSALAALREFQPTVMLLDIGMPGMDGIEVARRTQNEKEGRDLTLIALTGWGQLDDRKRTTDAGFHHHLIKPVDIDALQELLTSLPVFSTTSNCVEHQLHQAESYEGRGRTRAVYVP